MTDVLTAVILGGGSGTRLWPLSRETHPKQFLDPEGDGPTLLQRTARRLEGLDAAIAQTSPIVVCHHEHRFLAAQQLQDAGVHNPCLILESHARGTAPALTLAALSAPPDAVLLAMPADHLMRQPAGLHQAIRQAWPHALAGAMLTFGIRPDRPETGFGYIRLGRAADKHAPVHQVERFVEKPDAQRARDYLADGRHLWNSGLFMVRASQWLKALGRLQPAMLQACQAAMSARRSDLDFVRPDAQALADCPSDSIDYAVMEQLPGHPDLGIAARVVPLQAGWSDLGTWDALWESLPRDDAGNAHAGPTLATDSRDCLLYSEGDSLVAALGVQDLMIVHTPDAVLVAHRSKTQDVRQLVEQLRHNGGQTLVTSHRKVYRPWGWYDSLDAGERFQVKRIVVKPGAALSLQKHHHRAEHWIVVRGTAEVTKGEQTFVLRENESAYIPVGQVHRLANPGKLPLEVIEVQSGSYLGEDDIVRFDAPAHYE